MKKSSLSTLICAILVAVVFFSNSVLSAPVSKANAKKAAQGWLKNNKAPMERPISNVFKDVNILTNEDGVTLCYIMNLMPQGFVIISPNDEIEPIIAFSSDGYYTGDDSSPLTAILKKDMNGRLKSVGHKQQNNSKSQKKKSKWQTLIESGTDIQLQSLDSIELQSATSVSEVWVDPFLQSEWNQGDVAGSPCYNYYTPNNYPTGCVATAMAQVIRYHEWPTWGIGVNAFTIHVNGSSQTAYTRGGNGSGGAYNWAYMPYDPQSGVTLTQRQAIGALCYDAGVSVGMSYTSSGSSASLSNADQRLTATFDYSNSIYTQSFTSSGDSRL